MASPKAIASASSSPVAAGAFTDDRGIPVASGYLMITPNFTSATLSGGGIVGSDAIQITLDINGVPSSGQSMFCSDQFSSPVNPSFRVRVNKSTGSLAMDLGNCVISGAAPVDLTTLTSNSTGLSFPAPVLLSPSASQHINQPTGTELTVPRFNGRIFVDGTTYPLTQAGIQAAITAACAISLGGNPGTTLYLPPCLVNSTTGYTVTQPIKIIGSGPGQTALVVTGAGPVFTLQPAANNSQNQEWELSNMELICSAGDVVLLDDSTGFAINRFYLHDCVCQAAASSWAVNTTATIANNAFDITIERNYLFSGINLQGNNTLGTVDGVFIAHNTFDPALSATTAAISLNQQAGAAQATIFHNRGGLNGGFLVSAGCTQPKILYNQIEITAGSGTANNAIIDLKGTTYAIDGAEIIGNNINAQNQVTNCIRLDHATNAHIDGNVFALKTGGSGVGILLTSNATAKVGPANEFVLSGGSAISNAGTLTFGQIPDGTAAAPALGFINESNTGFLRAGSGLLAVTSQGSSHFLFNTAGASAGANSIYAFASTNDPSAGGADAGISRLGAGSIAFGNGSSGNTSANLSFNKVAKYNGVSTVSGGTPAEYATVDLTAQTAAIGTTTLYAVPASGAGQYRLSWDAKVTTAAGTSSTLGALTIVYTDPDGNAVTLTAAALQTGGVVATTVTTNSVTTAALVGIPLTLNCKASTNITYAMAYASNAANAMAYNLHIKLEAL